MREASGTTQSGERWGAGGGGGRGVQVRGQAIITPPPLLLLLPDPSYHHLSHLTEQCLMIINTLKHLRSAGSERTPERDRDERRGGRGKG